jgi:hypothetical protein
VLKLDCKLFAKQIQTGPKSLKYRWKGYVTIQTTTSLITRHQLYRKIIWRHKKFTSLHAMLGRCYCSIHVMGSFVQEGADLLAFGCFLRSYLHPAAIAAACRHRRYCQIDSAVAPFRRSGIFQSTAWWLNISFSRQLYGNLVQMGTSLNYTRKNLSSSSSYLLVVVQSTLDE